jgi:hypothetical protein
VNLRRDHFRKVCRRAVDRPDDGRAGGLPSARGITQLSLRADRKSTMPLGEPAAHSVTSAALPASPWRQRRVSALKAPLCPFELSRKKSSLKLSTVDLLALAPMKNAAKREMSCELQNIADHQVFERTLCLL